MLLVLGIVLLGMGLRTHRLMESLWYDEIAAWRDYGARGATYALSHFYDPANHVLHTALTSWSVALVPAGWPVELTLRLPALLFSLAAIVVLYVFGRRAAGVRTGLLCALLAAVLPISVLEGAEARGYSMMICLSAASSWTMFELLRRNRWRLTALAYAAATAAGVWAHLMSMFVPIGHAASIAWLAARNPAQRRNALHGLGAIALAAALTIAAYAPILDDLWSVRTAAAARSSDQPRLLGTEGFHALLGLGGAWTWWAALPGLALFAYGLATLRRADSACRAALLSLTGLPIMAAIVLLADTWMYARFTLFALPGVILVASIGIDRLWRIHGAAGVGALVAVIVVSLGNLIALPPKQPLRDAVEFVRAHDPRRPVVVVGLRHDVLDVYAGDLDLRYSGVHGARLDRTLRDAQPRWVVLYYPRRVADEQYELLRGRGFTLRRRFDGWVDWTNGDVLVYERDAP